MAEDSVERAVQKFSTAAASAEELPGCDGLDSLAKAALEHEPGKNCRRSVRALRVVERLREHYKTACLELVENRNLWAGRSAFFKREGELSERMNQILGPDIADGVNGEFTDPRCRIPALLSIKYRSKALHIFNSALHAWELRSR